MSEATNIDSTECAQVKVLMAISITALQERDEARALNNQLGTLIEGLRKEIENLKITQRELREEIDGMKEEL